MCFTGTVVDIRFEVVVLNQEVYELIVVGAVGTLLASKPQSALTPYTTHR